MPARLEINDTDSGLRIQVADSWDRSRIILNLLGCIFFVLFFRYSSLSRPTMILFGAFLVFTVGKEVRSALRGTNVELKVNNLDFISSGHAPCGYDPSITSRADMYNLEYLRLTDGGTLINGRELNNTLNEWFTT